MVKQWRQVLRFHVETAATLNPGVKPMNEAGASAREIALVGELTGDWWADVQVRSAILRSVKDSIAKCKARRENAERERDRLASEVVQEMILWTRLTKLSDSLELFGHEADDDSGPGF